MTDDTGDPDFVSYRTWEYKKLLAELPESIRERADDKYDLFKEDPFAPPLERKQLKGKDGKYHEVRISLSYRAVFTLGEEEDGKTTYIWIWIGSKEAAKSYIKRL